MAGANDIEARVRFLTTAEGGRRGPVAGSVYYRGQFHYEDEPRFAYHAGWHFPEFADGPLVPLGEEVRARVTFLEEHWAFSHQGRMEVGTRFQIQEGGKIVGRGVVTKVEVDPPAGPGSMQSTR